MKQTKKIQSEWMLGIPILIALVCLGGFYTHSVLLIGCLICVLLGVRIKKTSKAFYKIVLLCALVLISIFGAIDKGMAWYGMLRVFVFAVWIYYLMQFTTEEKDKVLSWVPYMGIVMMGIGGIAYRIPEIKENFWQAERFGGTFQYSNTCALFFIIGIVILARKPLKEKKEIALLIGLIAGVLLTGSRGGILILLAVLGWTLIVQKEFRKKGIFIILALLVVAGLYGIISGNFQNIARIYTLLGTPTTLLERWLYTLDAFPLIFKHPLGLGYMGYASVQPQIQTGIYTTMFVHNEWLQLALDYGIGFLLVTVLLIGNQLIKGKQEIWKKVLIFIICAYSLLEFHFQYLSILMILTLLWDFDSKKMISLKKAGIMENRIFISLMVVLFAYFGIASYLSQTGNSQQALQLYPYDTKAKEAVLLVEGDKDKAVQMANELLELNEYNTQAYNTLAYAALVDGDVESALNNKFKILEIDRFNMAEYKDFVNICQGIILSSENQEDIIELCERALEDMDNLLKETEKNVNPIAYELRETPVFSW